MSFDLAKNARAGIIGLSLVAVFVTSAVSPATADELADVQGEAEQVTAITAAALEDVGAAAPDGTVRESAEVIATSDGTLTVDGAVVEMSIAGTTSEDLVLPVAGDGVVTSEGTVVFSGQNEGLRVEVQPVDEGVARVLAVANESYTSDPLHHYAYGLSLPAGATLHQFASGEIGILQDPAIAAAAETDTTPVNLDEILPDASEVDQADLASNSPSPEVLGDDSDELSDNQVVVGMFQPPWAVDSLGQELPTSFKIENGDLVLVVDTTAAEFPVVCQGTAVSARRRT